MGGLGQDRFVLAIGEGTDTIIDFGVDEDQLGLSEELTFKELIFAQNNSGVGISVIDTRELLATLIGVEVSAINETIFFSLADI